MTGDIKKRHRKILIYEKGIVKSVEHQRDQMSQPGELREKTLIEEETPPLKGKAVLLSPPTPPPVGFSHFYTNHLSFESGFSRFSVSQLWLRPEGVCAHSESLHTVRFPLGCWLTPAGKHSHSDKIKCFLLMKSKTHNLL